MGVKMPKRKAVFRIYKIARGYNQKPAASTDLQLSDSVFGPRITLCANFHETLAWSGVMHLFNRPGMGGGGLTAVSLTRTLPLPSPSFRRNGDLWVLRTAIMRHAPLSTIRECGQIRVLIH